MRLVEHMTGSPPNCFHCGRGNVPDEQGVVGPFIDFERDVNWGDDAYLCGACGAEIALLFGFEDKAGVDELRGIIEQQRKQIHDTTAELERKERRAQEAEKSVETIRAGSNELRRVRRQKVKS